MLCPSGTNKGQMLCPSGTNRGMGMNVVTAEQMRDLDRRAMEEFGMPGVVLMENAGRAVVQIMEQEYGPLRGKQVMIFCGSGNNGGDGFVVARYLKLAHASPHVAFVGKVESLKPDAKVHYDLLTKMKVLINHVAQEGWKSFGQTDLIVDALLGTGGQDAPRGLYAEAIENISSE